MKDTLLLIDGFNLLSRGYFATAYGKPEDELPRNEQGLLINGVRVFIQKLMRLIADYECTHVVVTWDVKREETTRRQEHAFYKASREELPSPLLEQFETTQAVLTALGIEQLTHPPFEADDIIGTLSYRWTEDARGMCFVYSNDKDLYQLLNETSAQILAQKKQELVYRVEHFVEEFGVTPERWVDIKALLGDKSDNLPGCHGIGPKSALPLIQRYGSVEELYAQIDELDDTLKKHQKKLIAGYEDVLVTKSLAQIQCRIPTLQEVDMDSFLIDLPEELFYEMTAAYGIKAVYPDTLRPRLV
ncbi:5'-3' exonuclease [Aureibacillus halotolerans]|uniref:5'-3' exonuclease n=1 Tax=Aureibacillus halotolerans TaxID=1508390 RepID=A0A4R6U9V6_9BACI|nr:5'-3' exonuclease [Aureibacillus halotolerans]TDQ42616.1 5'-3' exonuclease [Aureibacillus halotolerans]